MFEQASRRVILALAEQPAVQQWVRRHGMRLGAARFVAGETVDAAIRRVRELNGDGLKATIDYLGESARSAEEARQALAVYLALTERVRAEAVDSTISVKPTQMGLALDPELAYANLLQLGEKATGYGIFMRLDMEASPFVEPTLRLYRKLRDRGIQTGVVIQAYLYRSWQDLQDLARLGANVRLVKGAYAEPASIAFRAKAEVDENYRRLIAFYLTTGNFTAVATHDERIIAFAREQVARNRVPPTRYEFQMLYGIRPGLQRQLVAEGEPVRVYVPFGTDWYPYLMRRLAERPANLAFFLRNVWRR